MNATSRSVNFCATIALSLCVLLSANARLTAGTIDSSHLPTITMSVASSPTEWDYSPPQTAYSTTSSGYALTDPLHAYAVCDNTTNVTVQQLEFNPDPFVLNNLLVTNTTAVTQLYSVTVGLPTSFGAPNLIKGNITTSVQESGFDTATIATISPTAIYQAKIDGGTVAALQSDPFSITTSTSAGSSASFGLIPNGIAVSSSIGIQLTFSLTAGDTAAILSRFDVVVPEPTGLFLCVLGLAAIFGRMRHR